MIIISKREKELVARPEREELMNIPSTEAEHKTRKMGGGDRKPRKLVIYIYIYIKYTYMYIFLYMCI